MKTSSRPRPRVKRKRATVTAAPGGGSHRIVSDKRALFKAMTKKTPIDRDFRELFLQNKLRIAHTHPGFDLAARNRAVVQVAAALGVDARDFLAQPIPGGVGYGVFYDPSFKKGWGRGTSLAWDIVCPDPPGGNINTWLYLTAMNRAGKGVEALVSYNGQNTPHFQVFDWARADQWQTDILFTQLADYLTTISAHGYPYKVLPVWNSTWFLTGAKYRNQVLLYNHVRGGWDLVYEHDYTATDADQKDGWPGTWGPIVETFQASYNGTSRMGALATLLISADNNGTWGTWTRLGASDSHLRMDNVGYQRVFLDPNYAFTVDS